MCISATRTTLQTRGVPHLQIEVIKCKKLDAALCPACTSSRIWSVFAFVCVCVSLSGGWVESGMGLSLAVVVRLSQWNEACCFIGQAKLLRQGFCWRFDSCQSQMELHNMFNPSGLRYESGGGSATKRKEKTTTYCSGSISLKLKFPSTLLVVLKRLTVLSPMYTSYFVSAHISRVSVSVLLPFERR